MLEELGLPRSTDVRPPTTRRPDTFHVRFKWLHGKRIQGAHGTIALFAEHDAHCCRCARCSTARDTRPGKFSIVYPRGPLLCAQPHQSPIVFTLSLFPVACAPSAYSSGSGKLIPALPKAQTAYSAKIASPRAYPQNGIDVEGVPALALFDTGAAMLHHFLKK